jgi:hypothetical protein
MIFESLQIIKFLSVKFAPVLSYSLFWFRQKLHPVFFSLIWCTKFHTRNDRR